MIELELTISPLKLGFIALMSTEFSILYINYSAIHIHIHYIYSVLKQAEEQ